MNIRHSLKIHYIYILKHRKQLISEQALQRDENGEKPLANHCHDQFPTALLTYLHKRKV